MSVLQATVPQGAQAGDKIPIIDPATGQHLEVVVPLGLFAGQVFSFTTAAPQPQVAVAVAVPVQPMDQSVQPRANPQQPAEVHVHHYHDEPDPQGMSVDRGDPEYLDASEVEGCWFVLDTCGCFPGFEQYQAVSPDEIKTGECVLCLGVIPDCNDAYPIWSRVGPRIWRHPDLGEMHFDGPHRMHGTCGVKLCRC